MRDSTGEEGRIKRKEEEEEKRKKEGQGETNDKRRRTVTMDHRPMNKDRESNRWSKGWMTLCALFVHKLAFLRSLVIGTTYLSAFCAFALSHFACRGNQAFTLPTCSFAAATEQGMTRDQWHLHAMNTPRSTRTTTYSTHSLFYFLLVATL